MALISQIYHITGPLEEFILTWLLLSAPLVYIMRSSLVSLLVISCATWYAILIGYQSFGSSRHTMVPYFYLGSIAFILPHYYHFAKSKRNSNFFHLHNWFLVVSGIVSLGAFVGKNENLYQWVFIGYFLLFGIYYLLGESKYFAENRLFANPFLIAGVLGQIIILLMWSYDGFWNELSGSQQFHFRDLFASTFFYISLGFFIIHGYLLRRTAKFEGSLFDPLRYSVYVFVISILFFTGAPVIGLLIMNAWILMIAIFYVRKGTIRDHLGILNFGLLIVASLALLRFFDDSMGFFWRGLFFVATGIGFFLANYFLLKRRKAIT